MRRQVQVVGGDQRGDAARFDQRGRRVEDVIGGLGVEIAARLVGKQDVRRIGDGA
jgi:1,4-dihydroxy-2-naphthoyl-CoA synthase